MALDGPTTTPPPWWQRESAIAWAILLFFPLGLYLMWRYAGWRARFKWTWTALGAFVVLIIVAGGGSSADQHQTAVAVVTATSVPAAPTQTATPTPIQTTTPTPTAAISAAELQYRATLVTETSTMATSLGSFSQLMANPRLGNATWTVSVAAQLAIWRAIYAEAQKLAPPPALKAVHEQYLSGLALYNAASFDIAQGMDQLDASLLTKALAEINAGNRSITAATALLATPTPSR